MEATGSVLRRIPYNTGALPRREFRELQLGFRPRTVHVGGGFSDDGHLRYYASPPTRCGGGKKKEDKKRMKLVKDLSRDLSALYSTGFGLETGEGSVGPVGEVKGRMISEAAEVLLAQLEQLRAAEKEMKRKRKVEKAAMKAARLKDKDCAGDDTSSSSSSESSDSDCECEEVVNMSSCVLADAKTGSLAGLIEAPEMDGITKSSTLEHESEERSKNCNALKCGPKRSSITSGVGTGSSSSAVVRAAPVERIEVCIGGKCKKSGALALIEEFERRVGVEGAVVGCKCMGKCRDGPNVRVMSQCNEEQDSVRMPNNPVCIGVGLEDVGAIVANFFGERKDIGLQTA